ncbi:MAG TPA: ParB/Srx family N-terminal domain-containing protein [Reyranella sp.]|nr:ParB/Srx family N-terminal domain-containing protein [Reyranella sp.]HTE82916.1 ParB/Srx family N-terminal domain-containing protein [Reyranella sp.]
MSRHALQAAPTPVPRVHDLAVIVRSLAELKPSPFNARKHSAEQVAQIAELIRRYGWTTPVLIDENDMLIAGHGRVAAGQSLGLVEGPTITLHGLTDREKRELMLADNKIAINASWNVDQLKAELVQLRGDGSDLASLGFAPAELDKLMPAESATQVEELDVSTVGDRFWISVRGPLASQARALQRLRELMAEVPGVVVEQGTVANG